MSDKFHRKGRRVGTQSEGILCQLLFAFQQVSGAVLTCNYSVPIKPYRPSGVGSSRYYADMEGIRLIMWMQIQTLRH